MDFSSGLTRADTRRSWQSPHEGTSRGFTLIELIVVVVIVGIFAAIAIPSFGYMIHKSSVTAAANELYDLLQYSRGEAVTRSTAIIIKASNGWNAGITIAKVSADKDYLRQIGDEGLQNSVTIESAVSSLTFSSTGNASASTCFKAYYSSDKSVASQYITVLSSGRINAPSSVSTEGCP